MNSHLQFFHTFLYAALSWNPPALLATIFSGRRNIPPLSIPYRCHADSFSRFGKLVVLLASVSFRYHLLHPLGLATWMFYTPTPTHYKRPLVLSLTGRYHASTVMNRYLVFLQILINATPSRNPTAGSV